jgi:hypothetical protein
MSIPYLACMLAVAQFHHLPPRVLPTIQHVEGGSIGAVSRNANGSEDLGLMQINTIWIAPVSRHTGLTENMVRARLIEDGCFNIAVAGAIMRIYLNEAQGDLLRAVGYYHSHTPEFGLPYRAKVLDAAASLFNSRKTAP